MWLCVFITAEEAGTRGEALCRRCGKDHPQDGRRRLHTDIPRRSVSYVTCTCILFGKKICLTGQHITHYTTGPY